MHPTTYTCKLNQYVGESVPRVMLSHWDESCSRRLPRGIVNCHGTQGHFDAAGPAYPRLYRGFDCGIAFADGAGCSRQMGEDTSFPQDAFDTGWQGRAAGSEVYAPDPGCFERLEQPLPCWPTTLDSRLALCRGRAARGGPRAAAASRSTSGRPLRTSRVSSHS